METVLKKEKSKNIWNGIWSAFSLIMVILVILKFFVYQQVTVVGSSMSPNYSDGELLMVNQFNKKFERGRVVAVYADKDVAKTADYFTRFNARFLLKRIIGLPGESIEIVDSNVIIYNSENPDGAVLVETYIDDQTKNSEKQRSYYYPKTRIPENNYFVMGDNRSNSTDSRSRTLGFVPDYAIFGLESIRFWPIKELQLSDIPEYSYTPISDSLKLRRTNVIEKNSENSLELNLR